METDIFTKLNAFGEISRLRLAGIFNLIPGKKNFIIQSNIIKPLERICGVQWLRSYNVMKIYKLEESNQVYVEENINVYFISSNLICLKRVLNEIELLAGRLEVPENKYHVIMVPKVLGIFESLLEESGLYEHISLYSFQWQFMHLDAGLYSLEFPTLFSDVHVNNDLSLLPVMGQALSSLFCAIGKPRMTITIGRHAQNVHKHVEMFSKDLELLASMDSDLGALLIMDRSIDYVTTLLTTVTYSGLLNEVFKVNCGMVESRPTKLESVLRTTKVSLTSLFNLDSESDATYCDIRDRHISEVSDILGDQARQLKLEKVTSKEMALSELKTYIQTKLQKFTVQSRFFTNHLSSCEEIIARLGNKFEKLQSIERSFLDNTNKSVNLINLEDIICNENDYTSLKLMCLMSLTQKLSYGEFSSLKMKYLHSTGYQHLYLFQGLINCGLMLEPTQGRLPSLNLKLPGLSKKDFYSTANKLKLIPSKPEEVNVRGPTCPSYVFGGSYIPVAAQLIHTLMLTQDGKDFKSKLDLLAGNMNVADPIRSFPLQQKTILLCIVGGVTYAEIAACSLVEKLTNCKIVICTNCVVSGNDLLSACV